jgi:hypothetical protein
MPTHSVVLASSVTVSSWSLNSLTSVAGGTAENGSAGSSVLSL